LIGEGSLNGAKFRILYYAYKQFLGGVGFRRIAVGMTLTFWTMLGLRMHCRFRYYSFWCKETE